MKKWFYLIIVVSSLAFSQEPYPGNPQYKLESNLVVLNFVPGKKSAKLFFAGSKVATLDLNKDAKILSVVMLSDAKRETLQLRKDGTSYEVESQKAFPKNYQIIVETQVKDQSHELRLKINNSKP